MKKSILAAILMVAALSSCITQHKCNERYPLQLTDSIKTETVYKDVLIHDTIVVDGREIVIHDSVPCPELNYFKETRKNGLTESVKIFKGVITATCKQDSLQLVIDSLFKLPVTTISESKTATQKETINVLTKGQAFLMVCGWLFFILILLNVVYITFRIYVRK
jgi:hypothetical protein